MARLDPVIRNAITPPDFGDGKLHREHLVDRLHGEIPAKLVAIAAPAGYGKTTLLADFTSHTELPVCWVRITQADQDVMRLATVLFASLERRFRRLRNTFDIEAFRGASPQTLAGSMGNLIQKNIDEAFIIVLDDIHILNAETETIIFLDTLLDRLPDHVTIFSAGREVIEVSLAKLMAEGNLAGFGPHDLAFDYEETRRVLQSFSNENLNENAIRELHEQTQGWITGLLLSQNISSGPLRGPWINELGLVHEYLASVVLNRLPDRHRRFMLDASVLPVMSEQLCDELLEYENSKETLEVLLKDGVFLFSSVGSERMYEFHPLFREFLLKTLEASDHERLTALRRKASEILQDQSPHYSFDLLIQIGDKEKATEVADKFAPRLFRQGLLRTLEKWGQKLDDLGVKSPVLQLYLARAYGDRGDIEIGLDKLDWILENTETENQLRIEAVLLKGLLEYRIQNLSNAADQLSIVNIEQLSRSDMGHLKGHWHRLRALLAQRGVFEELDSSEEIKLAKMEYESVDDDYYSVAALQDLIWIEASNGNLYESRIAAEEVHQRLLRNGSPIALARSFNDLGMFEYLSGHYHQALSNFNSGRKYASDSGSDVMEATTIFSIADLFSDCGLFIRAASMYEDALLLTTRRDLPRLTIYGCLRTSVLHRRAGNLRLAVEWLQRARDIAEEKDGFLPELIVERVGIELGSNPILAIEEISDFFDKYGNEGNAELSTKILAYRAQAYLHSGNHSSAIKSLQLAIHQANETGFVQQLASELRYLPELRGLLDQEEFEGKDPINERLEVIDLFHKEYEDPTASPIEPADINVRAMGTMEIMQGEDLIEIKPQALEVFLYILDNKSVERDILIEEFWNDHPPGRQTANLHMAIYSIRQSIGKDAIQLDGTRYRISSHLKCRYDVRTFENAARVAEGLLEGDPRLFFALTEAINAYQGEFLPNIYSDWVGRRRRNIELRYLDLIVRHAEEALIQNQPNKTLQILRDALEIDPYRDDLNLRYLEVLGRLGRRSDIISHYQRYSEIIKRDMGLQPSMAIQEFHARILKAQ